MDQVSVNLKDNSYPIYIGCGILDDLGKFLIEKELTGKCAIITNPTINKLYGNQLKNSLKSKGLRPIIFEVPDSETSKSLKQVERLYIKLLNNKFDRNSNVIAFGGGVIGDLAGFVAATYMRGISLVQVPTTLTAQADSAIGGKVAIDLTQGKNLVGAFHQPKLVISDIETLITLPKNQLKSGLVEVMKYGIISDPELFNILNENIEKIKQKNIDLLNRIVTRCSKIKASVIEEDEKEYGKRIILNLGHTLGHALEVLTNYSCYSHGEAIAIGILFASKISLKLDLLSIDEYKRIINFMQSISLPSKIEYDFDVDEIIETMHFDKKVCNEKIRFVLPKKIGEVIITNKVPLRIIKKELKKMLL